MKQTYLIGTYTKLGNSKGLYLLEKNLATEKWKIVGETKNEIENPTYTTRNQKIIYATVSMANAIGGVCSYELRHKQFIFKDKLLSDNSGPCHIDLDQTNNYLITSHYHHGKLELLKIKDQYAFEKKQIINHKLFEEKGQTSHVHFAKFTKDNNFIIVCDLGLDALFIYPFNQKHGLIEQESVQIIKTQPLSGPRHFIFHPVKDILYVLNELSSSIILYTYNNGNLSYMHEIFPFEKKPLHTHSAAIKIHPNGKYLYTSERGTNQLNCYNILENGMLIFSESISVEGLTPRDFEITPDGKQLLIANQDSDTLTIFDINKDGTPCFKEISIKIPNPVYISFWM